MLALIVRHDTRLVLIRPAMAAPQSLRAPPLFTLGARGLRATRFPATIGNSLTPGPGKTPRTATHTVLSIVVRVSCLKTCLRVIHALRVQVPNPPRFLAAEPRSGTANPEKQGVTETHTTLKEAETRCSLAIGDLVSASTVVLASFE
jgi:hypothetical protein